MNKINNLVREIQATEEGSFEYEVAFSELFGIIHVETIQPKVRSFSRQIRGDIAEAESIGAGLLVKLVGLWKDGGNFHSYYKKTLDNELINFIRYLGRDMRRHNTSYEVSFSHEVKTGSRMMMDEMIGTTTDDYEDIEGINVVEELLISFGKKSPTYSGIINVMMDFRDDMPMAEKVQAYCGYYEVDEYCSTIQKRVSRARKAFRKHIEDSGYGGILQ